jgi:hypothetical protein
MVGLLNEGKAWITNNRDLTNKLIHNLATEGLRSKIGDLTQGLNQHKF